MWFHFKHNQPRNERASTALWRTALAFIFQPVPLLICLLLFFSSQDLFFIRALFSGMLGTEGQGRISYLVLDIFMRRGDLMWWNRGPAFKNNQDY